MIGVAGLLVGIASLVWMVRNWLDKRFKRLDRKLNKRVEKKVDGKLDELLEKAA